MENPTRGLNVQSAASTRDLLRRLAKNGAATVFASADLEELMAQASRILVCLGGGLWGGIGRLVEASWRR